MSRATQEVAHNPQTALLQVVRNIAIGLVGQAVGLSFQLAASIMVTRRLGASGFGLYSSALAFAMLFSTLADAGVTNGLTRELAVVEGRQASDLFGAGLLIKAIGGVVVYIVSFGAALVAGFQGEQMTLIALMLGAYQLALLTQTAIGVGRAKGRMEIESGLVSLQGVLFLIWVLAAPATPLAFGAGWLFVYGVSSLIGMGFVCIRLVRPRMALTAALTRQIWAVGLPLMISAVLMLIYTRLPIYQMTILSNAREIGLFNAPSGLIRNLQILAVTLSAAVSPVLARQAVESPWRLRGAYTLALRMMLLIVAPIAVGASVMALPITLALFGAEYAPAAFVLTLSAWSLAGFSLSFIAQSLLVAQIRAGRWVISLGVGVIVSAVVGFVSIPRAGAAGAAIAALVADICIAGIMIWETRQNIDWAKIVTAGLRTAASAAAMGLVAILLRGQPIWASVPLSAVIYLALIIITRTISPAEIAGFAADLPLPPWLRRILGVTSMSHSVTKIQP